MKKDDFKFYREKHLASVTREKALFTVWYDKAAEMVFSGRSKEQTIDSLAPWGCDPTQSNGVTAGALQASRLLKG